jgi:hypothetical protein
LALHCFLGLVHLTFHQLGNAFHQFLVIAFELINKGLLISFLNGLPTSTDRKINVSAGARRSINSLPSRVTSPRATSHNGLYVESAVMIEDKFVCAHHNSSQRRSSAPLCIAQ